MFEPWMSESACADMHVDPDLFFSTDVREIEIAKNICAGCPVALECIGYAVRNGEKEGMWGGLTGLQLARRTA